MKPIGLLLFCLLTASASSVDPLVVIANYAKFLESGDCDAWAKLFSSNGCKIDSPAPSCGYDALLAFCQNKAPFVGNLAYSLRGTTLVSHVQDSFYCLAGFLLGGRTASGTVISQSGFNSFVINATTGRINECTGYLEQQAKSN